MYRVTHVEAKDDYKLFVEFEDGVSGEIDLSNMLDGPVFGPLNDPHLFKAVGIDGFGVINWVTGADLAPDALYKDLKGDTKVV
jgi:hypothetical protein